MKRAVNRVIAYHHYVCRFTASFEFREIKLLFNLQRDIPLLIRRYNIAPSQEVPVIVQNDGVNELKPMKWGLVPSWVPLRLFFPFLVS
jgi:putative SOS response-associated peptidase YedK